MADDGKQRAEGKDKALSALELSPRIYTRDHGGGAWLAAPVSDLSELAVGSEASVLSEQQIYLEALLADATPEQLARYSASARGELFEVEVELPAAPRRRRLRLPPVSFCCISLPTVGKERWVLVPALRHTLHVAPDEDLHDTVADEVRRIIAAREPSPAELLALLPASEENLEAIEVSVERKGQLVPGRARAVRRKLRKERQRQQALEILHSVATRVDDQRGHPPLWGRKRELAQLEALLGADERLSVMLVGSELCGKTALFRGWLAAQGSQRLCFATSGARLVAGMSGLGQWQERLRRVLEAAQLLDAVLYVETLADIFSDHPEGKVDIAAALRPWLDEGKVRLVAETRPEQLDRYEARHAGFVGCLQRLSLAPLASSDALEVLESLRAHHQRTAPQGPQVEADTLQPLCDLVDRYYPHRSHPGKAVRLYEQLRTRKGRAEGEVGEGAKDVRIAEEHQGTTALGQRELYRAFSLQSGIPEALLRQDRGLEVGDVIEALAAEVVGQHEAIRRVAELVCVIKARLAPPDKPLATFLFAGPTGVGKTALARALARYLFADEGRLTRFDMSEYMDGDAAERLVRGSAAAAMGAPAGEGELTKKVRRQPFSVLLLDEIEKAHPAVFDLLLQVLGEGRLTDAGGRTTSFVNTIVIMTSNLGTHHREHVAGLVNDPKGREGRYIEHIERAFRPELVNRIDRIVRFSPLTTEEVAHIATLAVAKICQRHGLAERRIRLEISPGALGELGSRGYSATYGARQLARCLEDQLVTPVAELLAQLPDADGATVHVSLADDGARVRGETESVARGLRFTLRRGKSHRRRSELRSLADISALRRDLDGLMRLDRVVQVREQIDYLVAQLSAADEASHRRRRKAKSARQEARERQEHTELLRTHQRLDQLWGRAAGPHGDLLAAEELALAAVTTREPTAPYLEEARRAERGFISALAYLLVALQPRRDEETLLAQKLEGPALRCWLLPLLEELPRLGWTLTVHGRNVKPLADDDWRLGERGGWGPPRPASWLRPFFDEEGAAPPFSSMVLRVRGPYACLLALETGVHVYEKLDSATPEAKLLVRHIAPRHELEEEEWKALAPAPPEASARIRKEAGVRRFSQPAGPCRLLGGEASVDVSLGAYWRRFEEVACAHLLAWEQSPQRDLDDLFAGELPAAPGDEDDEDDEEIRR